MQKDRLSPMGGRIYVGMITAGIDCAAELARKAGVPRATLHRLMYETMQHVDASALFRISDELNLSARWILHGSGQPNKHVALPPNATRIASMYMALPPAKRNILMHCATDLSEVHS